MNCQETRELIEDALDKRLSGGVKRKFDLHLAHCRDCRRFYAAEQAEHSRWFRAMNDTAAEPPHPLPSDFADRLVAAVASNCAANAPFFRRFRLPRWAKIAACLTALASFVSFAAVVAESLLEEEPAKEEPVLEPQPASPVVFIDDETINPPAEREEETMNIPKRAATLVAMTASLALNGASPDVLTFITGGSLTSTEILSVNAASPTTVFEGVSLEDYEPAYAYFTKDGSNDGAKYFISDEINTEILRPYNVIRATENGAATMTVQFQGVTRFHVGPHTASVTIKFTQSGDNVVAYVARAAALRPLDIELGLDLDAMVDNGDPRVEAKTLSGIVGSYNISVITMRKPAAAVAYTPYEGDTISDALNGNGVVSVTRKIDETTYDGYLPADTWTVVAENHDLRDLDEVEGFFHWVWQNKEQGGRQTAYNLKYSAMSDRNGYKTCQFQHDLAGSYICALIVEFRQNGANVEARSKGGYSYNIEKSGYASEVVLGMDFEIYSSSTLPKRTAYNSYATDDSTNAQGVKDLKLKFNIYDKIGYAPYLPDGSFVTVSTERKVSDVVEVDAHHHWKYTYANGVGDCYKTGLHLQNSRKYSGYTTFQIQRYQGSLLVCLLGRLYQNGNQLQLWINNANNYYLSTSAIGSRRSVDFEDYLVGDKSPAPTAYYNLATADDANGDGMKDIQLKFRRGDTVTYSAVSTAPYGNDLVFAGLEDALLKVKTTAATTFPSNGVIIVAPYAELTLAGHVENPAWTQYRVMTNGTLALNGTWQTGNYDAIDLVGGTLSLRECESAVDSGSYISYVTLMNGALVKGKPARVGSVAQRGNWIVTGDSPSYCESGFVVTAAGGDVERTFWLNVNDVAEGSDFFVTGNIADFGTVYGNSGYWNAHVVKDGLGTMEISGDVTLPNEICVSNGVVKIADGCTFGVSRKRSTANGDGSEKKAEIWLAGGALETAAGATNTLGKVVAKMRNAPLNLGDGSKLTLAGFEYEAGASLLVSDNLGNGATLCVEGYPVGKDIKGIRCGADGKRVKVGEDGSLVAHRPGLAIVIR